MHTLGRGYTKRIGGKFDKKKKRYLKTCFCSLQKAKCFIKGKVNIQCEFKKGFLQKIICCFHNGKFPQDLFFVRISQMIYGVSVKCHKTACCMSQKLRADISGVFLSIFHFLFNQSKLEKMRHYGPASTTLAPVFLTYF